MIHIRIPGITIAVAKMSEKKTDVFMPDLLCHYVHDVP